ncbi:MAG: hypothetical protein NVS1B11_32080 [Terriglobales bacterium]
MVYTLVSDLATTFGMGVAECREECRAHLEKATNYSMFVVNASRPDAFNIAAQFHKLVPRSYVIFVSAEPSAIRFEDGTAKINSNNWSVTQRDRDHLIKAIITGVRVTEERSRFRTKLAT